jgi:hypothetical protein
VSLGGGAKILRKCEANLCRPGDISENVFDPTVELNENNVVHTCLSNGKECSGSNISKT